MRKAGTFLAAMLYGASWVVVLINLVAIVASFASGGGLAGSLPSFLGAIAVILYMHYQAGWFPFRRQS